MIRRIAFAALAITSLLAAPTDDATGEISDELVRRGWQEITFDDYRPNRWEAVPGGVRVISDGSVSVVAREFPADLASTPILTWRWRTDAAPAPTNLRRKSGEDRAMAIYVAFPWQPERARLNEILRRRIVESLAGRDAPGRILTYVWGGDEPRGSVFLRESGANAVRIMRTPESPVDEWLYERVDVVADFEAAFGWRPPNPTHVGLTSDSDDTGRAIDAVIVDIEYQPR